MATAIDCRTYYIDRDAKLDTYVNAKLGRQFCQNSDNNGDTGCGFSVSKYLIDRPGRGIEQNSSESSNQADNIVCFAAGVGDATNIVASEINEGTRGHASQRPLHGRLRRLVYKLESFLRDIKVELPYFLQ